METVAVDKTKTQFATASADSTIKVWATRDPSQEESMEYLDSKNKKRRKTSGSEAHKVKASYGLFIGSIRSMAASLTDWVFALELRTDAERPCWTSD